MSAREKSAFTSAAKEKTRLAVLPLEAGVFSRINARAGYLSNLLISPFPLPLPAFFFQPIFRPGLRSFLIC